MKKEKLIIIQEEYTTNLAIYKTFNPRLVYNNKEKANNDDEKERNLKEEFDGFCLDSKGAKNIGKK